MYTFKTMKLINLNLQCGIAYEPTMEFIKKYVSDTDIFCFQEVFHDAKIISPVVKNARPNLFTEIMETLPEFNGFHLPAAEEHFGGLAIFIKKSFVVNKNDNVIIFPELNTTEDESDESYFAMGRNLQRVEFGCFGKTYTILNFHGMWTFRGKMDTDKRIEQSEKVKEIFDKSKGARILCTDLNVTPETKSLAILKEGNKDLVEEFGITSTRSLAKNRPEIVDYVIASPEVEVEAFKALPDEVSDHLPLLLEFS